jgi:hypothetical protein
MTDEELKALVASLTIAQQKTDEQMARNNAEIKARFEALEQQIAQNNIIVKQRDDVIAKQRAEKLNAQMARTDARLDKVAKLVGNINNNQGDIAEEFFYCNFKKNPKLGDIQFDSVSRNLNNHLGDIQEEYDLVLINGDTLALIEVKAKAHINDLEKLVNRKLVNFPKLFHVYKNFRLYAGIATLVTNQDLIERARELGLFLLTQNGKHAEIVQTGRCLN